MEARLVYLVVNLVLVAVFSSSVFASKIQPVYSLKNLGDHQYASGKFYQRVQVKCNTTPDLRYIHRNSGNKNWCVNGDSSECFAERIDAATRSCNIRQSSIAVPVSVSPKAQNLQAQVERQKLEQELLENEQRKIELRSQQLELRKRELELLEQQNNN